MANEVIYDELGNVAGFNYLPDDTVEQAVSVSTTTLGDVGGSSNDNWYQQYSDTTSEVVPDLQSTSSLTSPSLHDTRIMTSMRYPVRKTNNHFVRFFINVDEESTLITQKQVEFSDRPVDFQDQNRNNNASSAITGTNLKAATTILSGMVAASAAKHLFSGKGQAVAVPIAAIAGGVAGASGAFDKIATETLKLSKKLKRLKTSITLYAPPSISTSHYANYDLSEDKLIRLMNSDMASEVENIRQNPSSIGSVTGRLGRILATTNSTVSSLSRTAYNPKKDLLFKSMGNRSFSFEFQFAPSDSEEALMVRDIIYAFKLFSHPEVLKGFGQFLYLYPAEFDIKYGYIDADGKEHENTALNKISSCVLESISVNYGPQGSFQSLENGEPIITNMSLRFKEIETLTQDRIKAGY